MINLPLVYMYVTSSSVLGNWDHFSPYPMAFQIQWQVVICFAIVVVSTAASLWVISRKNERAAAALGRPQHSHSTYESLPSVNHRLHDGDTGVGRASGARHGEYSTALWTSGWSWVLPVWLLVFRLMAAVALTAVLVWDVWTYDTSIMMYYYTEWTLLLLIAYFAIATMVSAQGCWKHSRHRTNKPESDDGLLCSNREQDGDEQIAGSLGRLMQIAYQAGGGAVVLTDVVFWGIIVPFMSSAHFSLNAIMCCMHSLNLMFLLMETAINNLAFPWFRMAYFVLWTCAYVIFQWIVHASGLSWWPYPFLEITTPWAPLWYFAMTLLHFPCYGAYWMIIRAKKCCFDICL